MTGIPSSGNIHPNRSRLPRSGRITLVGVTSIAVSTGASRPPGRPAVTAPPTPAQGSRASPPPIPSARGSRGNPAPDPAAVRNPVRLDTGPEAVRVVRAPLVGRADQLASLSGVGA